MFIPRPYQVAAFDAVRNHLDEVQSTLAILATGLGKSCLIAMLADWWLALPGSRRVLCLAHRRKLVSQVADQLYDTFGIWPQWHMPMPDDDAAKFATRITDDRCIISSNMSSSRSNRLEAYDLSCHWLVIIDEAHRAHAESYYTITDHFRANAATRYVGLTATPDRADRKKLIGNGAPFSGYCYEYNLAEAVADAWLTPLKCLQITCKALTKADLKVKGGDYDPAQLDSILAQRESVLQISQVVDEQAKHRPTIVFTAGVGQAIATANALNDRGSGRAAVVSSWPEHKATNAMVFRDFARGDIQFVCNSDMLVEGYDEKTVACVVRARPTKSRVMATQQLGRGTRTLEGVLRSDMTADERTRAIATSAKPYCLALDLVADGHKMVYSPDCLLPANATERQRKKLRDLLEKDNDEENKPSREYATVASILADLEEEEEARTRVVAQGEYVATTVDIYGKNSGKTKTTTVSGDTATAKQIAMLIALGVAPVTAFGYSKKQAHVVIGKMKEKDGRQPDWGLVRRYEQAHGRIGD